MARQALPKTICLVLIVLVVNSPLMAALAGNSYDYRSDSSSQDGPFSKLRRLRINGQGRDDAYGQLRRTGNSETNWPSQQKQIWYGNPDSPNASSLQTIDKGGNAQLGAPNGSIPERGSAAKGEPVSDLSQSDQMRLQMDMDRKSKAEETLSNVLKKQSDTGDSVTQNMK
jgi:hypothetical protein